MIYKKSKRYTACCHSSGVWKVYLKIYTTYVQKYLPHDLNMFSLKNMLQLHWYHKKSLLFKRLLLKFSKVPIGMKWGSRRKSATQFCALSEKMGHQREKSLDKIYLWLYIYLLEGLVIPEFYVGYIIWCGWRSGRFCGGLGRLSIKTLKWQKKWPNFETTILTNYGPKFRLLFIILNLLMSDLLLL